MRKQDDVLVVIVFVVAPGFVEFKAAAGFQPFHLASTGCWSAEWWPRLLHSATVLLLYVEFAVQ